MGPAGRTLLGGPIGAITGNGFGDFGAALFLRRGMRLTLFDGDPSSTPGAAPPCRVAWH